MADRIYLVGQNGRFEPLAETPFPSEDALQALIAQHPEVLAGEQMSPDAPRRWILITREMGIADAPDSGARWAVDHLLIDQDAIPTLVEVKRGSNSEVRRAVVGQLLEYAAHASRYWRVDELRRIFEDAETAQGREPGDVLAQLLDAGGDPDVDAFWQRVATNLAARRLRLLFVADEIPDPLIHIVEFLNAQMHDVEVLAVEVKQYRNEQMQTVVPRVIGREAGGSAPRATMTRKTFLDALPSPDVRNAAERLFQVAATAGAELAWGSRGVSIRGHSPAWTQPVTVAWLYPNAEPGWMRTRDFSFGTGILDYDDVPEDLLTQLRAWADQFRDDTFTQDVSSQGVAAWAVPLAEVAPHADLLIERLRAILAQLHQG